MPTLEDYEAIISAKLHEHDGNGVLIRKTVVVIWDSSSMELQQCSMLSLLDQMGHIVIAPYHPERPISPAQNFSDRAFFYASTNPYGTIDATYWKMILSHAKAYSGQPLLSLFLIVGNEGALKDSNIGYILQGLKSQILLTEGATIQVYRGTAREPYNRVVSRYCRIVKSTAPDLWKRSINGMPAPGNTLTKDSLISGALERVKCAARLGDASARELLEDIANTMLRRWSSRNAFPQAEPIFITLGGEDKLEMDDFVAGATPVNVAGLDDGEVVEDM
ncbi:hypothetical protein HBH98_172430 [Parastagonospora nodorum]|nr:hypothetical protein HBH43_153810 [Parastagonospora nodorum]KAH4293901.1 hypothetical protein HBI01_170070 [Parastagonospora nodorum]KAH4296589.1 hypothetical protein HBI02_168900 [Parastagonospora nodorum]KAH4325105.1 hypothetical protein HBI00_160690 [Parastagonospora nodorum]KAH4341987.1 hypothetical protein HBH98_172430 [Parastagonospora nodorum]